MNERVRLQSIALQVLFAFYPLEPELLIAHDVNACAALGGQNVPYTSTCALCFPERDFIPGGSAKLLDDP
jgi:hypothetical protein